MHTFFDASTERWHICIEDVDDPALEEFAFPDEARQWLQNPEVYLNRLTAVQELFPSFMTRLWRFVAQDRCR